MKKWKIGKQILENRKQHDEEEIFACLLRLRGLTSDTAVKEFVSPKHPKELGLRDVGIDVAAMANAVKRIRRAIMDKESIVVYADYDADGITAGAVMWETLWKLGARVMPYIPHREGEGYGLSEKGIDAAQHQFDPSLIITVDHGITAYEKVAYAKKLGIDVIVTDHHTKQKKLPACTIVHTTQLSGSGVSWFVARELSGAASVELAAVGTVADLLPLTGANRSIVMYGLKALRTTSRVGLSALMEEAGITKDRVDTHTISHMIAPRINAMGRIDHALDALRLLCTNDQKKAGALAQKLGLTNATRQKMTEDSVQHALGLLPQDIKNIKKLIFIADESYNQGIIGLIAGRLTEAYYRPSVVLSTGEEYAKASARSISGFNIIEAIRKCSDVLIDAGGHPMAAGLTVETRNISLLQKKLEQVAEELITEEMLQKTLSIDLEMPLSKVSEKLWGHIQKLSPFGIGNPQPVFASKGLAVRDVRIIGATRKHVKMNVRGTGMKGWIDAVAFNMADMFGQFSSGDPIDLAYTLDMNEWNGRRSLQLKVRDVRLS